MSQAQPIAIAKSRRSSVFDIGGENSVNNFASSIDRSVNYLSKSYDSKHTVTSDLAADVIEEVDEIDALIFDDQQPVYDSIEVHSIKSIKLFKSTPIQTIFNSINVLIGLGILSIPLAFHLSGWILGILCISLAAFSTKQTAVILGKILDKHPNLKSYQDIGVYCFGEEIGFVIMIIFMLDLLGAGISMVLLFADSINTLINIDESNLKFGLCLVLIMLNCLPLRILSFLSLSGIICTSLTCGIICISGLIKPDSPGSLFNRMPTNIYPTSFIDFLFSLGLYMAPWGGHATFPEIFKDQLFPETYNHCMNYSFTFSYLVDLSTGVMGFLMFGKNITNEVSKNILITEGYPRWVGNTIVILMGLLPISKLPLISRPIVTIMDDKIGNSRFMKCINRIGLSLLFFLVSTVATDFGQVMALLGSLICFTVCLTLPCLYHIIACPESDKFFSLVGVFFGIVLAIAGTVAVFLK